MDNYADIWKKILHLTNGTDVNGVPLASGIIAIDKFIGDIGEKEMQTIKNIPLMDGIFQIHSSGGCAVITIEVPSKSRGNALQAQKMCEKWLEELENPEYDDQILTLTITPILLQGYLFLVYNQLVYAELFELDYGVKLVLGFDNLQTVPVQNESENFYDIVMAEEQELRNQEEEIRRSIIEAENIVKEKNNPYKEFVDDNFSKAVHEKEAENPLEENPEDKPKRDYFS